MRNGTTTSAWASAYIQAQQLPLDVLNYDHHLWWAIEHTILPATVEHTEAVWAFILEVINQHPPQSVVQMLGAGPVEDILDRWGDRYIERIEVEARNNPYFKKMLTSMWECGSKDVWSRVQACIEN